MAWLALRVWAVLVCWQGGTVRNVVILGALVALLALALWVVTDEEGRMWVLSLWRMLRLWRLARSMARAVRRWRRERDDA